MKGLIDKLDKDGIISEDEFVELIENRSQNDEEYAAHRARCIADSVYGKSIFIRGLIEISNICRNDCYYCGIRKNNCKVNRYRLNANEIIACCEKGHKLGFRTFVLQGGEDAYYTDELMVNIITAIKEKFPECAVTLSLGEKPTESYRKYRMAGADRYLLRHETADEEHYKILHPESMLLSNRIRCLRDLKEMGFQTGCGFMVGSPGQSGRTLAKDFRLIHELKPAMVGIGPFIPHTDTPFDDKQAGTLKDTVFLLSILRIMEKDILIPATTALATIHPEGRKMGILAGANVVMPNLTPVQEREKYMLYDKKACIGVESAEGLYELKKEVSGIGYNIVVDRGDVITM